MREAEAMQKARAILGLVAGATMMLSSATHSLLGWKLLRAAVSVKPAIVIGTTYVVYGGWALTVSRFDPFFLVFVVPGLMVLLASVGRQEG